jgi:suppressor of ftsI
MRRLLPLFVVVTLALGGCGGGGAGQGAAGSLPALTARTVATASSPPAFPEPPEVDAVHGVATIKLTAAIDPATGLPNFTYEGQAGVAPTVRVRPGDTMVFDVYDRLPGSGMKSDINLHFHGLTVSPNAPADDVLTMLAQPGGHLHYVVPIPRTQEPGLYWYHPHVHGQTDYQVGESGMSGAIVVDGLQRHLPQLASMPERILIIRDVADNAGAAAAYRHNDGAPKGETNAMPGMPAVGMRAHAMKPNAACGPDPGIHLTVNNVVRPTIPIDSGQSEFFRIVNATGHRNLVLHLDGIMMQIVAIDGVAVDAYPGEPSSLARSQFVVAPAGRLEFVATGTHSAELRTLCYNSGPIGDPDPEEILANLRPSGTATTRQAVAVTSLRVGAPLPQNFASQPVPPPVAHRIVNLTESGNAYYINGKRFEPNAPPMFTVRTGTVEEWTINNESLEVHDFHLHQVHFYVEAINGEKVDHPVWRDTAVVPVETRTAGGTYTPGWIKVLVDFRNPVIRGTFIFHCHILDHEDGGMMAKIQAI